MMYDNRSDAETTKRQLEAALRFERIVRALALAAAAIAIPTLLAIVWWVFL